MRNSHGIDEVRLERGLDGRFDFLDAADQAFDGGARTRIQQRNARARASGITRRSHVVEIAVGNHAEHRGVLHIDMATEGASKTNTVHGFDAEAVHEQADARIQRSLGELDSANVVLRNAQHLRAFMQHIGEGAAVFDDTR